MIEHASIPARFFQGQVTVGTIPVLTIPVQTWGILTNFWGAAASSDPDPYSLQIELNGIPIWGWYWPSGFSQPTVVPLLNTGYELPMFPGDELRFLVDGGPTTVGWVFAAGRWIGAPGLPGPTAA